MIKDGLTYTPARIDAITQAALEMSSIGTLLTWAGRAATEVIVEPTGPNLSRLGIALAWAGDAIEDRCATINEAVSNVGEWKP